MMEQGAAGSFCWAYAFVGIGLGFGANVLRENFAIVQQLLESFDAVENLNQPGLAIDSWTVCSVSIKPRGFWPTRRMVASRIFQRLSVSGAAGLGCVAIIVFAPT